MRTRREFLPFLCGLAAPLGSQAFRYDLLIKGGRVVDPSQSVSALRDVAISAEKIVRLASDIPASEARITLDARGRIVTPGLVDIHVHVYDGVAPLGIPADPNCIAKGATTVLDAGSAGAHTFPGFRRLVIQTAETRVFALLNISVVGQSTLSEDNEWGELLDLRYANAKLAVRTIERNRDVILGMKVRLSRNIAGDHDIAALRLAREAAEAAGLPVMAHIGDTASPLPAILKELRPGDVITHSFHGRSNGILDGRGRVLPEVRKAVENGVRLDVGHGRGSFSWRVMEAAMKEGVLPGTISSDVHQFNVAGPVFDLATTLSKFLHLGMALDQVIERATINPARTFRFPNKPGTLQPGAEADVAVFQVLEGDFDLTESFAGTGAPETRVAHRKLLPVATVKAGRLYGSASIPVTRL
ncbi:MAG TPA: amidohydrolase/deacetylase family metallohydrolase [Bryobacteraceae bacterium]|jgi:dihydroorotase|nr:amidohydrolase/deacetylase family metallohydrolase [Bryobacteraceae bacterium]